MGIVKSRYPRDILNEIKWKGIGLDKCTIYYIHRGAPDDTMILNGSDIMTIGRSFFETAAGSFIPYHRIFRIDLEGVRVYKKLLTDARSYLSI